VGRQVRNNPYVRREVPWGRGIRLNVAPVRPPSRPKHGADRPRVVRRAAPRRDGPSQPGTLTSLDAFEESSRMKWTCWIAALVLCCGSVNANAGLFDGFGRGHKGHDCCPPTCAAPVDCCPPTCAAPADCCPPVCAAPAACCPQPTCCAPAAPVCCAPPACPQECCPAAPSCCAPCAPVCAAPAACCDQGCAPVHHCRPAKKHRSCLSGLFDRFRRGRGHGCKVGHHDCCPPTCAAPAGCY
jgi:hypothetical protein